MQANSQLVFAPFRLDPVNQQIWNGDQEIRLRPKTFEVLRYLLDHPGQLVTKDALLDAVWKDGVVSDTMPSVSIAELRKVLGDVGKPPRFIATVHRRGYRFVVSVSIAEATSDPTIEPLALKAPAPVVVEREDDRVAGDAKRAASASPAQARRQAVADRPATEEGPTRKYLRRAIFSTIALAVNVAAIVVMPPFALTPRTSASIPVRSGQGRWVIDKTRLITLIGRELIGTGPFEESHNDAVKQTIERKSRRLSVGRATTRPT